MVVGRRRGGGEGALLHEDLHLADEPQVARLGVQVLVADGHVAEPHRPVDSFRDHDLMQLNQLSYVINVI